MMDPQQRRRRQLWQVRCVAVGVAGGLLFLLGAAQASLAATIIGGGVFLAALIGVCGIGIGIWVRGG